MNCPKCNSENVNVVMDTAQVIKKRSILGKLGRLFLICCTFGLWILVPKRTGHTKTKVVKLCQSCGYKF